MGHWHSPRQLFCFNNAKNRLEKNVERGSETLGQLLLKVAVSHNVRQRGCLATEERWIRSTESGMVDPREPRSRSADHISSKLCCFASKPPSCGYISEIWETKNFAPLKAMRWRRIWRSNVQTSFFVLQMSTCDTSPEVCGRRLGVLVNQVTVDVV